MSSQSFGFIKHFLKSPSFPGSLLLVCVAASLLVANSSAGPGFNQLLAEPIGFHSDTVHLRYSLHLKKAH